MTALALPAGRRRFSLRNRSVTAACRDVSGKPVLAPDGSTGPAPDHTNSLAGSILDASRTSLLSNYTLWNFVAGSHHLLLRALAILLALGAAGIPLNQPMRLIFFFAAAIWLGTGRLRVRLWNWVAAVAVLALVTIGANLIPVPRIEEGHNIFIRLADGEPLEQGLPAPAYKRMREQFDSRYPASRRCKADDYWCWARPNQLPERTFAFSADGAWSRPVWSRVVQDISFDDLRTLRLGEINLVKYNWGDPFSDVARESAPYFAAWRISDDLVGSKLCWRGETMWGRDQSFASFVHAERSCREILPGDVGGTVFALAIEANSLSVELEKSPRLQWASYAWLALHMSGVVAIALLLALPTLQTLLAVVLSAAGFLALVFYRRAGITAVHDILTKIPIFYGGDDGLTYEGWGRLMLQRALQGDWVGALRSEESIYYFQPGIRYFRMVEKAIFGETEYGYLLLFSLFPVVLYKFVSHVAAPWIAILIVMILFFGVGASFGLDFYAYTYWMMRGFAEPIAYMLFLLAMLYALRLSDSHSMRDAAVCGLLVAVAIFLRTNLAVAALVMLAVLSFHLVRRAPRTLAPLALTSALTLLIPFHNIYYGKRLVLLTSTVDHNETLVMPPWIYGRALVDLASGATNSANVGHMLSHLTLWLGTERGSVPLHAAALAVLLAAAILAKTFAERLLTTVAIAMQFTLMFWRPESRFGLLAWLLTFLTIVAFLYRKFSARAAPPSTATAA